MNNQWMKIRTGVMLLTLSLMATANLSAQQWSPQTTQQWSPQTTQQWSPQTTQQAAPLVSVVTDNINDEPAQATRTETRTDIQRTHSITLAKNGAIEGRIASIDAETRTTTGLAGLNVYFIRNGKIAHQTKTRENGSFELHYVDEGPYSFVATGPTGFAAYGVYVLGNQGGQNRLNFMEAAAVSPRISGIKQVLAENLPTQIADEIIETAELADAQPSATTGTNKVRLIEGQLFGQVTSLFGGGKHVEGTIVNLVQNGRRVADVQVDQQGNYSIPDLEPGVYDFIAVGIKGIAALRFEAVSQDSPMTQVGYRRTPVLIATTLDVCLTCQQDNSVVDQSVDYAVGPDSYPVDQAQAPIEYASQSAGFSSASGGSCGCAGNYAGYSTAQGGGAGGGGAGGGGRIGGYGGRILSFGALAVGIAAIASDNGSGENGNGGYPPIPPPQSPYGGYGY